MAETISFETGLKTFDINGKCEVTFNPTDFNFLEKLYNAAEALDKIQNKFRTDVEKNENSAALFDLAQNCDIDMRNIIDGIFGAPICSEVFAGLNVFAVGDGLPLWANLLYAVVDKMDSRLTDEKERAKTRIRKYSEKYKKK